MLPGQGVNLQQFWHAICNYDKKKEYAMLSVLKIYGIMLLVFLAFVSLNQFRKVNDDGWWVKGTPKNVRIKETIKDICFIMLGIISCTGFGVIIIMFSYI